MSTDYVIPAFYFSVNWGEGDMNFTEVSGLTMEAEPIEYREGLDPVFTVQKIPGLRKFGNITLKRGVTTNANDFFKWYDTQRPGTVEKRNLTISLLNEAGDAALTWKIREAWVVKVEAPSFNAKDNEIAIESMEIAHEGVVVEAAE